MYDLWVQRWDVGTYIDDQLSLAFWRFLRFLLVFLSSSCGKDRI